MDYATLASGRDGFCDSSGGCSLRIVGPSGGGIARRDIEVAGNAADVAIPRECGATAARILRANRNGVSSNRRIGVGCRRRIRCQIIVTIAIYIPLVGDGSRRTSRLRRKCYSKWSCAFDLVSGKTDRQRILVEFIGTNVDCSPRDARVAIQVRIRDGSSRRIGRTHIDAWRPCYKTKITGSEIPKGFAGRKNVAVTLQIASAVHEVVDTGTRPDMRVPSLVLAGGVAVHEAIHNLASSRILCIDSAALGADVVNDGAVDHTGRRAGDVYASVGSRIVGDNAILQYTARDTDSATGSAPLVTLG